MLGIVLPQFIYYSSIYVRLLCLSEQALELVSPADEVPSKWHMSLEAHWEVEAVQKYVAALARFDMGSEQPIYLSVALDFPLSFNGTTDEFFRAEASKDLMSLWGPEQAHIHDNVVHVPLNWVSSTTSATRGSYEISDAGVAPASSWRNSSYFSPAPRRSF